MNFSRLAIRTSFCSIMSLSLMTWLGLSELLSATFLFLFLESALAEGCLYLVGTISCSDIVSCFSVLDSIVSVCVLGGFRVLTD